MLESVCKQAKEVKVKKASERKETLETWTKTVFNQLAGRVMTDLDDMIDSVVAGCQTALREISQKAAFYLKDLEVSVSPAMAKLTALQRARVPSYDAS